MVSVTLPDNALLPVFSPIKDSRHKNESPCLTPPQVVRNDICINEIGMLERIVHTCNGRSGPGSAWWCR